jgi:hypothetical protein
VLAGRRPAPLDGALAGHPPLALELEVDPGAA